MRTKSRLLFAGRFAVALVLLYAAFFSQAQMSFVSIGDAEVIPDNVVTDIVQDKQGYLWIATPAGVVRYDGYRYALFEHDPLEPTSLGGNFVRSIQVFNDGTLWFATEPGGVSIYHPESKAFSRLFPAHVLLENPGLNAVSQVLPDTGNQIWLATNSGLYQATREGEILRFFTVADGIPHNGIRALLRDSQGHIWVGTRSGLARFDKNQGRFSQPWSAQSEFNDIYVRALFEDDNGAIWIGSDSSGLWRYESALNHFQVVHDNLPENFQNDTIYDIFQANQQELWVARFGGIDRFSITNGSWLSRSIHDPSNSFSLANNDIRTLLKDKSGMIWVGGYGGGVQRRLGTQDWLQTLRFSLLRDNALTEPNVSSILALSNGDIWVGTRGDGINIVTPESGVVGGHFPQEGVIGELQSGWVTAMDELPSGDIWVGVNPGQLYRYESQADAFRPFGEEHGLPRANIRVLLASQRGGVWVGTNGGLYYWHPVANRFIRFLLQSGETMPDGINALHEQQNGQLLVATGSAGLFVVPPDAGYLVAVEGETDKGKLLSSLGIVGMLSDTQNRLWLDLPVGLHLVTFDETGRAFLENHSEKYGYGGRPMGANLLQDKQGRIWSPSFLYNPDASRMMPLQRADGIDIGTSWYRSFTQTADGQFLFGGSRGLLMMQPEKFEPWDFKPPLIAAEVRIDGELVNSGELEEKGLTLQPDQRSFSVEFAALDLSAPEKNQYRYQLLGYDNNWTQVDATRRIASYSNLWPGEYRFVVEGTNRVGQWSDKTLNFKVKIKAQYWQSTWFISLCVLLTSSLIYAGFRIRTEWIKARARALEQQVEERTQELRKAQQDFIEQEKMASLGGLVAGVAHEINTPMGIALTAATALDDDGHNLEKKLAQNRLKRSDLVKHIDKLRSSTRIILSSLDRACALIASFKQVAVDQTSEQRRDFDMGVLLQDIARSLHSLYRKQGHQLHLDCPEDVQLDSYPGALFQIITNLINNSVLHGFSDMENGMMTIHVDAQQDTVTLRYSDDGKGMTKEVKKKAFEPFFTTRLGVGGSGLGMHLVYNYVTKVLGGKITIESAPGSGFSCQIIIPRIAPVQSEDL